jgi:hypothetical protein
VDPQRQIYELAFGLNADGSFNQTSYQAATTGGTTNFPIGLTGRGQNNTGWFVAAVRGTDGKVYIEKRPSAASPSWSGWAPTVISAGPAGTPIRVRESTSSYNIVTAKP